MSKEEKFFKALQDVFIGAKIEGQGGFVNLMRIKSNYYRKIEELLKIDIEKALKKYPAFKDELFDKLYSFFSRYFTQSGSIYFNSTPFHNNVYEKVYTDDKDVILFWKTQMLYYVKTDRIFRSLEIESDGFKFYFDVSRLEHKKANEKRTLVFEFNKIKEDQTIVFNIKYSERGTKTKTEEILRSIKRKGIAITEEQLERAFRIFEKQSEVDFFINKNAKAFLQEQFKLWSYQYFWEGAQEWTADRVNQLQILKDIAFKIIDFISQFEDELVRIWNKPKFVKNSNYVITLDRIFRKFPYVQDGIFQEFPSHRGDKGVFPKWYDLPYNPKLKEKAKKLRKAGNLSEVLLWNEVKGKKMLGLDFDRQKIIGDYIVDFFIKEIGTIVEIDGSSHNEKIEYDKSRDEYFTSLGLNVIHILDSDVKNNLEGVLEYLKEEIKKIISLQEENTPSLRDTPLQEGNVTFSYNNIPLGSGNTPSANASTPLREGNLLVRIFTHPNIKYQIREWQELGIVDENFKIEDIFEDPSFIDKQKGISPLDSGQDPLYLLKNEQESSTENGIQKPSTDRSTKEISSDSSDGKFSEKSSKGFPSHRGDKGVLTKDLALTPKYKHLPLDTKYFKDLEPEILSLFDDLDKSLDGWLIKSENYQALNTILPKFKEKVQTIYIDPPFNLDSSDQFLYRTNYKDANWATLLENRLRIAKEWLNNKGSIFVRCDYNGNWIVRPLMNEIFGKENFRNEIIVKRGAPKSAMFEQFEGVKSMGVMYDNIFWYSLNPETRYKGFKIPTEKKGNYWSNFYDMKPSGERPTMRYKLFGKLPPKNYYWKWGKERGLKAVENYIQFLEITKHSKETLEEYYLRTGIGDFIKLDNDTIKYWVRTREEDYLVNNWLDIQGYSSGWSFSTENSEILLKRIVESTSNEKHLILDFFLGSGTTTAVAHKLGRKWIGVEMGEHFYTVVLPRMKKVLFYDPSGISKELKAPRQVSSTTALKEENNSPSQKGCQPQADGVVYQGGGFFKYYELEQYEDALANCKYEDGDLFNSPSIEDWTTEIKTGYWSDRSPYQEYVFLKDEKMLKAMEIDYKNNKVKVDLSKLYPNIDIAETLSNLTGKWIKRITPLTPLKEGNYEVEFEDGTKINTKNLDYKLIKPLIWWE